MQYAELCSNKVSNTDFEIVKTQIEMKDCYRRLIS